MRYHNEILATHGRRYPPIYGQLLLVCIQLCYSSHHTPKKVGVGHLISIRSINLALAGQHLIHHPGSCLLYNVIIAQLTLIFNATDIFNARGC
jgi:hypothetical protein